MVQMHHPARSCLAKLVVTAVSLLLVTTTGAAQSEADLFAIKKVRTGSNTTEVHVLSAASGFQGFSAQTRTGLHETDGTWVFLVADVNQDGRRDLVGVKKTGTGSGRTEIHALSGADGFQRFVAQIGTGLHEANDAWVFAMADMDRDGRPDLVGIKKRNTGSRTTEIHALSAASGFKAFNTQTGTGLHETDDSWVFTLADLDQDNRPDLVGIKQRGTGSGTTELHALSGASGFRQFVAQTRTGLHETDNTWVFGMSDLDGDARPELVGIKKSGTGSRTTEVHALSAASGFQQFIRQTKTGLHETDDTWVLLFPSWVGSPSVPAAATSPRPIERAVEKDFGGGKHGKSRAVLDGSGLLTVTTQTWTNSPLQGFTMGVKVFGLDRGGGVVLESTGGPGPYGVDGTAVPLGAPSSRTDAYKQQFDESEAAKATELRIWLFHAGPETITEIVKHKFHVVGQDIGEASENFCKEHPDLADITPC